MADATAVPDYGLDAPDTVHNMFSRAAWSIGFGLMMFLINRGDYPGPSLNILIALGGLGIVFLAVASVMVWSSRVAKPRLRDQLLDAAALTGDDKVLDVGCGLGLLAIGAAKRVTTGRVTGVDIWSPRDLAGPGKPRNSADLARANAKTEGVEAKVRFETCDARKLTFPDASFDAVVSCLAIHNIDDSEGRDQAVREMLRVLKPGGRLALFDIFHTASYA